MKPGLLLMMDVGPLRGVLEQHFTVHQFLEAQSVGAFLAAHGREIHAAVRFSSSFPLSAEQIDLMPGLKIIAMFSAGFEGVDLDHCDKRGIAVTTCSGANAGDVADMAFGLLLAAGRGIAEGDRFVRAGKWTKTQRLRPREGVFGRRLGILGLGAIGAECARRAAGFDMGIGYHNRKPRADMAHRYFEDLGDLAEWCDFLIVACPLTEATRRIVDAGILRRLGAQGVLINIARGEVVDQDALIEALETGVIEGAGLDVFVGEPEVPERLKALDNVVMTPHYAGWVPRVFRNMGQRVVSNLLASISGGELVSVVNRPSA